MPAIILSVAALVVLIVTARLVSIYSSELFYSSEEILASFTDLSERRRRFIEEINHHPHDLMLTAGLFKSLSLIIGTGLAVFVASDISSSTGWPVLPAAIIGIIIFWLIFTLVVEIMSPISESEGLHSRVIAHLGLVRLVYRTFFPLRRLAGVSRIRYAEERRDEEKKEEIVERAIETLAESVGADEPIIEEDERQMIQQIFRLDTTEVREVMVPRINIVAVEPTITLNQLRDVVRENGHSRIPVYENDMDTILGIIYVKDIFYSTSAQRDHFDIRKFIQRPLLVPETQKIDKVLEEFRRRRKHLAIVVDEYGGTAGLVSLEDIIEEIFGEIEDEHDHTKPAIVPDKDGSILVSGQISLDEITKHFDLRPFSEEFETVGGLIYDLVGGGPTEGQVLVKPPMQLTVTKIDGQRIEEVKIDILPEENSE